MSKRLAATLAALAAVALLLPGVSAQSWTLRHSDTFTDTAFTSIDVHTPNTGTGYTNPAGGSIRPTIDDLGTGMRNGGDNGVYITTSLQNDQKACMAVKSHAVIQDFRIYLRYDVNGGAAIYNQANGYFVRVNWTAADADEIGLFEVANGTATQLGSTVSHTWADNQVVCILAVGTTISTTVDGVTKHSETDGTYTSGTVAWYHGIGNGDNAVGDNFEVSDSSGGGGGSTPKSLLLLGVGGQ